MPRPALVFAADIAPPSDWPIAEEFDVCDAQLGHALGWVCEIRARDIVLLNPLGEGLLKAGSLELPAGWVDDVRADSGAAVYLLDAGADLSDPRAAVNEAARRGGISAATVRTAFAPDWGQPKPVARNAPCPCGSGRKFKQCHGR